MTLNPSPITTITTPSSTHTRRRPTCIKNSPVSNTINNNNNSTNITNSSSSSITRSRKLRARSVTRPELSEGIHQDWDQDNLHQVCIAVTKDIIPSQFCPYSAQATTSTRRSRHRARSLPLCSSRRLSRCSRRRRSRRRRRGWWTPSSGTSPSSSPNCCSSCHSSSGQQI